MADLTRGRETGVLLRFAWPMLVGNIFQQLYNVIDSAIVGRFLGKEALSAVGASFPIVFLLISLVIGIASGASILIAQYFGAKQLDNVRYTIDTLLLFLIVASIIIGGLGMYFSGDIFRAIQLPENLIPQANAYLQILMAGLVTMFGFNALSGILKGLGDSRTPLVFLIISTIANVVLDLLFILVMGMGVEGAALATVVAQLISVVLAIIYLNRRHSLIHISLFALKFHTEIFRKSVKIGLPTGVQQMMVAAGMMALLTIVNQFGTNVIAAYTVAGRINSFALLPAMNFSQALSAFTGQNIGANKIERVKNGLKATLIMSLSISTLISLSVIFFGKTWVGFFVEDAEVIRIGQEYLNIVGAFYFAFAVLFVLNGIFRGAGDTLTPMFITLLSLWLIRIPLSWWFSRIYDETGIWWGIPTAWFIGMIISIYYYKRGAWRNKSIIEKKSKKISI